MTAVASQYRPYPAYKPSGVDWLGDVPEHWDRQRVRHVFRCVNGATPKSAVPDYWDGSIVWVTPDDLGRLSKMVITESGRQLTQDGYQACGTTLVPAGSVVLSTRAPIGHLAIAGRDVCTNQGCRALAFLWGGSCSSFYYYVLLAAREPLKSLGQGSTFTELSSESLKSMPLADPPFPEQRAIADFLDRETGRIDALVEKKERLIELLEEKRTALISHAVTKGLNPDAPMKPSGVDWLGDVPEHWDCVSVRRIARRVKTGGTPQGVKEEAFEADGFPWYTPGDFGIHLFLEDSIRELSDEGRTQVQTFPPNTVMMVGIGSLGKVGITRTEAGCNQQVNAIQTNSLMLPRFLARHLLGLEDYLLRCGKYTTLPIVNQDETKSLPVPLPSLPEQRAIADFLDRETGRIDALIDKNHEIIEKLRERRTALISAAVTGKIDVREEVRGT